MNISTNYIAEGVMVVIPVFNCKNYISDAVSSIKKQPYKKIIIILVDDGSTDGSSEICDNMSFIKRMQEFLLLGTSVLSLLCQLVKDMNVIAIFPSWMQTTHGCAIFLMWM